MGTTDTVRKQVKAQHKSGEVKRIPPIRVPCLRVMKPPFTPFTKNHSWVVQTFVGITYRTFRQIANFSSAVRPIAFITITAVVINAIITITVVVITTTAVNAKFA